MTYSRVSKQAPSQVCRRAVTEEEMQRVVESTMKLGQRLVAYIFAIDGRTDL